MECSICGISDKMRNVSQALAPKGIVFVCDKCAADEGFPRLKKIKLVEPGKEKQETMYERMARLAGVVPREPQERTRHTMADLQEKSLRKVVDRNYEAKIKSQALILKPRPDLVDNFHWIIMRVRRVKGLTQKQLAERILEPESAIKMAEQGVVPEGYSLIEKLGRFLKVRLIKERIYSQAQKETQKPKTFFFDKNVLENLTIADLQRLKKEQETAKAEAENEEYEIKMDFCPNCRESLITIPIDARTGSFRKITHHLECKRCGWKSETTKSGKDWDRIHQSENFL